MPTVTSRVVAEIHRGIAFPLDWFDKPDVLNLGMARDLLVSVAAMFDADQKPLALCWRIAGGDEHFAHAQANDAADSSLLAERHRELAGESLRLGPADLLATLLWAPDELRSGQGQPVHPIVFARGRTGGQTGWNIPVRSLIAEAGKLLFMPRRADDGLAFPMPPTVEDMHENLGWGDPKSLIVLPGGVATVAEPSAAKDGAAVRRLARAGGTDQRVPAAARVNRALHRGSREPGASSCHRRAVLTGSSLSANRSCCLAVYPHWESDRRP